MMSSDQFYHTGLRFSLRHRIISCLVFLLTKEIVNFMSYTSGVVPLRDNPPSGCQEQLRGSSGDTE